MQPKESKKVDRELKKLDQEQFVRLTLDVNHLSLFNRKISSGLAWYTCLNSSYPLLAQAIRGTENDPSEDNTKLNNFFSFIKGF